MVHCPRAAAVLMPQAHLGCPAACPGRALACLSVHHPAQCWGTSCSPNLPHRPRRWPCRTLTPPCPWSAPRDLISAAHSALGAPLGRPREAAPAHSRHAGHCHPVLPARAAGPRTCERPGAAGQTTTHADFGAHPCILLTVPQASTRTWVSRGPRQGLGHTGGNPASAVLVLPAVPDCQRPLRPPSQHCGDPLSQPFSHFTLP